MKTEYRIGGISKILEKVSKEQLAQYYEVEPTADFEALILEELKERKVPNGMEIAGYETRTMQEVLNARTSYVEEIAQKYTQEGKAVVGMPYTVAEMGNREPESDFSMSEEALNQISRAELYFYIDTPIKDEEAWGMYCAKIHIGGVSTLGYTMGRSFYETHKDEIEKLQEEYRKPMSEQRIFENSVQDYFDKLTGRRKIERTSKEDAEIIAQITGGRAMESLSLKELEQIKQGLIARQEKVKEAFAQRFGKMQEEQETKE